MADQLTVNHMRRQIATKMAGAINNNKRSRQYAQSIEQYAAFVNMPTTNLQEKESVVRRAINDFPHLFPGLE